MQEMFEKLRERFDPKAIKTRKQAGKELQYVSIDATINRLIDVAGDEWEWHIEKADLILIGDAKYLGIVQGHLAVAGVPRAGVGVGVSNDPDTAIKTADAEALKKAGHKYGIGLELWDENVRAENEVIMRGMESEDMNELKRAVFQFAVMKGATPTKEGVMEFYGVSEEALDDQEELKALIGAM